MEALSVLLRAAGAAGLLFGGALWCARGRPLLAILYGASILNVFLLILTIADGAERTMVLFAALAALALHVALAFALRRRFPHWPARLEDGPPHAIRAPQWVFALSGGAALLALFLKAGAPAAGWDALTYHLEFPAQWLSGVPLSATHTAYGDLSPPYYPRLSAALYLWLMAASESARFLEVSALACLAALYVAARDAAHSLWRLARPADAAPPHTLAVAGLLAASAPYMSGGLGVSENDLALAALLCACLAWLLRSLSAESLARAAPLTLAAGLAAGFASGVKYTGALFALMLLAGFCLARAVQTRSSSAAFGGAGLLVCGWILGGGWQLALNAVITGNPLYPGELRLAGLTVFSGYYPAAFFRDHPFHEFSFYGFFTDPGLAAGVFCALAAPAFCLARWRRFAPDARAPLVAASLSPLVLFLGFYFFSPLRQHRLLAPALVLAAPLWALLVAELTRAHSSDARLLRWIRLASGAILALHLGLFAARLAELFPAPDVLALSDYSRATARIVYLAPARFLTMVVYIGLATGVVFAVAFATARLRPARSGQGAAMVLLGALVLGASALRSPDAVNYAGRAESGAWNFLRRSADVQAIGVVGSNAPFALRGTDLSRRVELLEAETAAPLHRRGVALEKRGAYWAEVAQSSGAAAAPAPPAAIFARARERNLDALAWFGDAARVVNAIDAPPGWKKAYADAGGVVFYRTSAP